VQVGNHASRTTGANHPSDSAVGRTLARTREAHRHPSRRSVKGLNRGKQRILDGLAELKAIGIPQPSRTQLSIVANLNLTGGSGSTYVGELTAAGLVEIPEQGKLAITPAGEALAAPITTRSRMMKCSAAHSID
jgi:predicted transcriptional regulator